jgi:hypothetical protein
MQRSVGVFANCTVTKINSIHACLNNMPGHAGLASNGYQAFAPHDYNLGGLSTGAGQSVRQAGVHQTLQRSGIDSANMVIEESKRYAFNSCLCRISLSYRHTLNKIKCSKKLEVNKNTRDFHEKRSSIGCFIDVIVFYQSFQNRFNPSSYLSRHDGCDFSIRGFFQWVREIFLFNLRSPSDPICFKHGRQKYSKDM